MQWHQQGDECHNLLLACSFGTGVNNWIFSQHIKYPPGSIIISETKVYVNMTYTFFTLTPPPLSPSELTVPVTEHVNEK